MPRGPKDGCLRRIIDRKKGTCGLCAQPNIRIAIERSRHGPAVGICCYIRPIEECAVCKTPQEVHARTSIGPVCANCYESPAKQCAKCGHLRPWHSKKDKLCRKCYKPPEEQCAFGNHSGPVKERVPGVGPKCKSCYESERWQRRKVKLQQARLATHPQSSS